MSGLTTSGRHIGSFGYTVVPGVAYSVVLWLVIINAKRLVAQAMRMKMITLLAVLTICSALWSQDPFRSAYNGGFYLLATLFAFYLVVKFTPEEILSLVMTAGFLLAVLGLMTVILLPRFGVMRSAHGLAWNGVFGDRTTAGKSLVFLLTPAVILRRRSFDYRKVIYIGLMSLMIFRTDAMTARILAFVYVALMSLLGITRQFGRRSSLIIVGISLVTVLVGVCLALPHLPQLLEGLGKNATLTGRTGIWGLIVKSIAKRPLLGYGYYAFWEGLKGESANIIVGVHWVFGYAHNGLLEVCLQLGLVGTGIFLATLFQAIRNAWFCLRMGCSPGVDWYIGLIALTIMYNFDECTVLWPFDLLSILYVIACCGLAKAARQVKEIKTIEALYN
jgi:exopolysaccharide production protein ExoQ